MRYWLMKSEPSVYGIDDLARDGVSGWEGVRNYQARNLMRDEFRIGDRALFYHSNATPPGVAGVMRVVRAAYPDDTAFDPASPYHDARSRDGQTVWIRVDVAFEARLPVFVPLEQLKADPALEGMLVIRRGMRLSVQPVERVHFRHICALGGLDAARLAAQSRA